MKHIKTILLSLALVCIVGGSYVMYNTVSKKYEESTIEQEQLEASDEFTATEEVVDASESEALPTEESEISAETVPEVASLPEETTKEQAPVKESKPAPTANTETTTDSANVATEKPQATNAPVSVPTTAPVQTAAPVVTATPAATKKPSTANTAPNFTVKDANGSMVSLNSKFGKPIVINFWASWCGPCKSEMATFNSMYQEMKDKVTFLMVDMVDGSRETEASGKSYVSSNGFTFPVYYDVNQSAAYAYSITNYPTTYFIDSNGVVSKSIKGALSASTLRSELNNIINK